jgi:serine/threonine protein kinase
VLYVATLGSRPFGNGANALRKILQNEYKAPRDISADYPEALEAIIKKALSPQPDNRFATAEDMQMALEEWLVTGAKLVTASDVAKCVRERISSEVRTRNDLLLSQARVAPERLMNQLSLGADNETPTAGSGVTRAPVAFWQDKLPAAARSGVDDGSADPERTLTERSPVPSESFPPAPVPRRPALAPRLSDATELVDFVPEGALAPGSATMSGRAASSPPEATRAKQLLAPVVLVLLALLAIAHFTLR